MVLLDPARYRPASEYAAAFRELQRLTVTINQQRRIVSRIGISESPLLGVQQAVEERDEAAIIRVFVNYFVEAAA